MTSATKAHNVGEMFSQAVFLPVFLSQDNYDLLQREIFDDPLHILGRIFFASNLSIFVSNLRCCRSDSTRLTWQ